MRPERRQFRPCSLPRTACRAAAQARKQRVDKVLSNLAYCTRRESSRFLKQHAVTERERLLRSGSDQVRFFTTTGCIFHEPRTCNACFCLLMHVGCPAQR